MSRQASRNMNELIFRTSLKLIATRKGCARSDEKLLAHPLFASIYVVYYAHVLYIEERSLECVCYTIIWKSQIKRHKKSGKSEILLRHNSIPIHLTIYHCLFLS